MILAMSSPGCSRTPYSARPSSGVPVAGNEVQPYADLPEEFLHRRRRALEQRHAADVHVRHGALLMQE